MSLCNGKYTLADKIDHFLNNQNLVFLNPYLQIFGV